MYLPLNQPLNFSTSQFREDVAYLPASSNMHYKLLLNLVVTKTVIAVIKSKTENIQNIKYHTTPNLALLWYYYFMWFEMSIKVIVNITPRSILKTNQFFSCNMSSYSL